MRNHCGKEGERWIIVFLSEAAESEITCYVSKDKLHFQPKFTQNINMGRMKIIAKGDFGFAATESF